MPRPQDIYLVQIDGNPGWLAAGALPRSEQHYSLTAAALGQLCSTIHPGVDGWIGGAVDQELAQDGMEERLRAFGASSIRLIIQGPTTIADVEARLGEDVVDAATGARPIQDLEF